MARKTHPSLPALLDIRIDYVVIAMAAVAAVLALVY
jgi:hypothetical protein